MAAAKHSAHHDRQIPLSNCPVREDQQSRKVEPETNMAGL